MGMLEKALAGAGQAIGVIGLEELKNQSFMKRQERLEELTGRRADKAYERDAAAATAANEAALAKEQRGYKHAEKLKGMDIAAKAEPSKREEVTFERPSDKKVFSQSELTKQFLIENKIPDIDPNQLMLMDDATQTKILNKLSTGPNFIDWVKKTHGIDITGGYKAEPSSEKAVGSGTMPWSQEQKPTSSYKSLWSE